MSQFGVMTDRMQGGARDLQRIAREVNGLQDRVAAAKRTRIFGDSGGALSTRIGSAAASLQESSSKLRRMQDALGTISDVYVEGERRIKRDIGNGSKPDISYNVPPGRTEYGDCILAKAYLTVSANINYLKKNYSDKGWVYDAYQYGKCAIKVTKGVKKIVKSVGAIASGVGIAVGICGLISGVNDVANAITDATYVYKDQHDKVGTTNYLKDLLKKKGGELGEMLGNEKAGETFGELVYKGFDLISGLDSMMKSYGDLNTIVTGKTGYSYIWGRTSFDSVMDNQFRWNKGSELIRSFFMDPTSDANFVYEAVHSTVSVFKKALKR